MSQDPKEESDEDAVTERAPPDVPSDPEGEPGTSDAPPFDEDASLPQMDAPALEELGAVPPPAPLPPPVHRPPPGQDEPSDEPRILRDNPFGDNKPGFAGDMPFFVESPTARFDFETDDTDGIPTGLPDLKNLGAYDVDFEPHPNDELPHVSNPVMASLVLGKEPTEEVTPSAAAPAPDPGVRQTDRLMGFATGVVIASLLWGVIVILVM